tara:strand:+ start:3180 stop:3632 length:453 start_codon:yes stop_codon:yes gene_type:complete
MNKEKIEELHNAVEWVSEIQEYDAKLKNLQIQAIMLLKDIDGKSTSTEITTKLLNIKAFKKQLSEKEAKDEAMWEELSITDPKLRLLSTINPIESEYIAQSDNTETIVLKLCPSESLIYLDTLKNILINRRNLVLAKLKKTDIYSSLSIK